MIEAEKNQMAIAEKRHGSSIERRVRGTMNAVFASQVMIFISNFVNMFFRLEEIKVISEIHYQVQVNIQNLMELDGLKRPIISILFQINNFLFTSKIFSRFFVYFYLTT